VPQLKPQVENSQAGLLAARRRSRGTSSSRASMAPRSVPPIPDGGQGLQSSRNQPMSNASRGVLHGLGPATPAGSSRSRHARTVTIKGPVRHQDRPLTASQLQAGNKNERPDEAELLLNRQAPPEGQMRDTARGKSVRFGSQGRIARKASSPIWVITVCSASCCSRMVGCGPVGNGGLSGLETREFTCWLRRTY
jgi:hypothetical protein